MSADQVPSVVPEWFREEWHNTKQIPDGWNAATPVGGAITFSLTVFSSVTQIDSETKYHTIIY